MSLVALLVAACATVANASSVYLYLYASLYASYDATTHLCKTTMRYESTYTGDVYLPVLEGSMINPENKITFDNQIVSPDSYMANQTTLFIGVHDPPLNDSRTFDLYWQCCLYEKVTWTVLGSSVSSMSSCSSAIAASPTIAATPPSTTGVATTSAPATTATPYTMPPSFDCRLDASRCRPNDACSQATCHESNGTCTQCAIICYPQNECFTTSCDGTLGCIQTPIVNCTVTVGNNTVSDPPCFSGQEASFESACEERSCGGIVQNYLTPTRAGTYNIGTTTISQPGVSALVWYPAVTPISSTLPCEYDLLDFMMAGEAATLRTRLARNATIVNAARFNEPHTVMCARDALLNTTCDRFPLILVASNETVFSMRSVASHLATRGFIVAVLDHPEAFASHAEVAQQVQYMLVETVARFGARVDTERVAYVGHDVGADASASVLALLDNTVVYAAVLSQTMPVVLGPSIVRLKSRVFASGTLDDDAIATQFETIVTNGSYALTARNKRLYGLGNYYGRLTFTDNCAQDILALYGSFDLALSTSALSRYDELRLTECLVAPPSQGFSEHTSTSLSILTTTLEEALRCSLKSRLLADQLTSVLGPDVVVREAHDLERNVNCDKCGVCNGRNTTCAETLPCGGRGLFIEGACVCVPGYSAATNCTTCEPTVGGQAMCVGYGVGFWYRVVVNSTEEYAAYLNQTNVGRVPCDELNTPPNRNVTVTDNYGHTINITLNCACVPDEFYPDGYGHVMDTNTTRCETVRWVVPVDDVPHNNYVSRAMFDAASRGGVKGRKHGQKQRGEK